MPEDYRVPVSRVQARLWLAEGDEYEIVLFCPPDTSAASLLEDDRRFFPALEEGKFMLVARDSVAALWLTAPPDPPPQELDLPTVSRSVHVHLSHGRSIRGTIRFVSSGVQDRTADFLNEPSRCFDVHTPGQVVHVAKRHVLFVLEE